MGITGGHGDSSGVQPSARYHGKSPLSSEEQSLPYRASLMHLDLSIHASSLSPTKSRLTPTHPWTSVGTAVSKGCALLLFMLGVE